MVLYQKELQMTWHFHHHVVDQDSWDKREQRPFDPPSLVSVSYGSQDSKLKTQDWRNYFCISNFLSPFITTVWSFFIEISWLALYLLFVSMFNPVVCNLSLFYTNKNRGSETMPLFFSLSSFSYNYLCSLCLDSLRSTRDDDAVLSSFNGWWSSLLLLTWPGKFASCCLWYCGSWNYSVIIFEITILLTQTMLLSSRKEFMKCFTIPLFHIFMCHHLRCVWLLFQQFSLFLIKCLVVHRFDILLSFVYLLYSAELIAHLPLQVSRIWFDMPSSLK